MNKINWATVAVIGTIVLLVFLIGASLLGGQSYGGWGFAPFGWIGMFFMWLIPFGFIVLTVLGIAWLGRALGSGNPPAATKTCPSCGRGVQTD